MDLVANRTGHRLIDVAILRSIFGGKALNAVTSYGAAVDKEWHGKLGTNGNVPSNYGFLLSAVRQPFLTASYALSSAASPPSMIAKTQTWTAAKCGRFSRGEIDHAAIVVEKRAGLLRPAGLLKSHQSHWISSLYACFFSAAAGPPHPSLTSTNAPVCRSEYRRSETPPCAQLRPLRRQGDSGPCSNARSDRCRT